MFQIYLTCTMPEMLWSAPFPNVYWASFLFLSWSLTTFCRVLSKCLELEIMETHLFNRASEHVSEDRDLTFLSHAYRSRHGLLLHRRVPLWLD